uniref:Cytidyltransferase-like domain-containing protein n=1 Tax=Panagrolaimus sp. JU765 TaxID=591449 RepID=A0AC34QRC9_9BILA
MDSSSTPLPMVNVASLAISRRTLPVLAQKLELAAKCVKNRLYIRLVPSRPPSELEELIPNIYLHASQKCSNLDVRVVLKEGSQRDYGVFLKEISDFDDSDNKPAPKPFKHVALGGTFDRLHNGHKVLLSTAAILSDKVTCGVTSGDMNKKKVLYELMEPLKTRMAVVEEFLKDISDGLIVDVQEITDPFGPAIVLEDLDCLVVSEETVKGGDACNVKRKERGLNEMHIHKIPLVEGLDQVLNEAKLSSSTRRRQILGTLLKTPNDDPSLPNKPYLVGLTGGIASGKTHISRFLEKNGCEVADADKIVHQLYDGNANFSETIAEKFGSETVANGKVDRKKLGEIVFNDKEKREKLTAIIWPAVKQVILDQIKVSKADIFVIDAALLVEAGWDKNVRQLWTTFVPRVEAIKRIKERDNLTEEEAEARIDAQTSNETRIQKSHVVFCSLWDYSETERQVMIALNNIRNNFSA